MQQLVDKYKTISENFFEGLYFMMERPKPPKESKDKQGNQQQKPEDDKADEN